jgi:hypothetical protein
MQPCTQAIRNSGQRKLNLLYGAVPVCQQRGFAIEVASIGDDPLAVIFQVRSSPPQDKLYGAEVVKSVRHARDAVQDG